MYIYIYVYIRIYIYTSVYGQAAVLNGRLCAIHIERTALYRTLPCATHCARAASWLSAKRLALYRHMKPPRMLYTHACNHTVPMIPRHFVSCSVVSVFQHVLFFCGR